MIFITLAMVINGSERDYEKVAPIQVHVDAIVNVCIYAIDVRPTQLCKASTTNIAIPAFKLTV